MVRVTSLLYRVPVIKFRKGGVPGSGKAASAPASSGATPAAASATQVQPAAAMSTGAINDFELPLRYQRQPLSQEEIDHINGGGIKDEQSGTVGRGMGGRGDVAVIQLPQTVLVGDGSKREEISLNIIVKKVPKKMKN